MRIRARSILHLAAAVVLCGCGAGPAPITVPDHGCAPVVLPLRFEHGLPLVAARVGEVDTELMVDLGGAFTVTLKPDVGAQARCRQTGDVRRFRNARGDLLTSREILVSELRLSSLALRDVTGYEQAHASGFAPPVDTGTIGLGLLREFRLLIDYSRDELSLTDRRCPASTLPEPETWATAHIVSDRDGVVVEAVIDGRERKLVLDTGATWSTLRREAVSTGGEGESTSAAPRVVLGGATVDGLDFATADWPGPQVDGVLGCNFFSSHVVQVDFEAGTVAFRPAAPAAPERCSAPSWNL